MNRADHLRRAGSKGREIAAASARAEKIVQGIGDAARSVDDVIAGLRTAAGASEVTPDEKAALDRQIERISRATQNRNKARSECRKGKRIPDRREEIAQLSAAGIKITAIAQELGIPLYRVVRARRELGLGNCRTKQVKADIARLNAEGMVDRQIALTLGLTREHVCTMRGQLGIPKVGR